ncbi:MAG: hypothetical protein AAF639_10065 [Chloroflexota bacterium]
MSDKQMQLDTDDEMLPEYDFSGGVRGKHAAAYHMAEANKTMTHRVMINAEKAQLVNGWVNYPQVDQQPIWLTRDDTLETVAVLFLPNQLEELQRRERRLYQWQLVHLIREIEKVEQHWNDASVQEAFVKQFPESTFDLWKMCPESTKRLCLSLDLAAQRLRVDTLTQEKLNALRHFIELIRQGETQKDIIRQGKQQLISAGLPPSMGGSRELADLYKEEL